MLIATLVVLGAIAGVAPGERVTPRTLPLPERPAWRPVGCRGVPYSDPVLLPRTAFRRAHGDLDSSNEVDLAYAPVFARQWIAEPGLYQVTTPAFDSAGNLYMTPALPHESILLISLDPESGARRFVVPLGPGERGGGAVPVVLRDPDSQTEVVYTNAYERVIAVRTDGSPVWQEPTGLGAATTAEQTPIGLAWVPNADAIVALTRDGYVLLFDRAPASRFSLRRCSCRASVRRPSRWISRRRWRRVSTCCCNHWPPSHPAAEGWSGSSRSCWAATAK